MHGHKEHEHRHHRETGGVNDAAEDIRDKPENYTSGAKRVEAESEERKRGGHVKRRHRAHGGGMKHGEEHHHPACKCPKCHGGRAERAHGGHVHHEKPEHLKHAKHVGKVEGEHPKHRADRMPRKSGGRTGADSHPFSSARAGSPPPGHKVEDIE
jgi:hypothetical protein